MKIFIAALAILLLSGCEIMYNMQFSSLELTRMDLKKHREKQIIDVIVIPMETQAEIDASYKRRYELFDEAFYSSRIDFSNRVNETNSPRLGWAAWTRWDAAHPKCIIVVPVINNIFEKDKFITWGHELAHCVYGEYHK